MSIENGYATLVEYKAYANITTVDATDDGAIENLIEAASRYIDIMTGRTFYARTDTRYYDIPKDPRRLLLDDDLLTVTTFTNGNGDVLTTDQYILIPTNKAPYFEVRLKEYGTNGVSSAQWETDSAGNREQVISLAGTWGFMASHTDDILGCCLEITRGYVNRRKGKNLSSIAEITAGGVVISPKDVPGTAKAVINLYKRRV